MILFSPHKYQIKYSQRFQKSILRNKEQLKISKEVVGTLCFLKRHNSETCGSF
jgi:hypothetical protein